MKTIFTKRVCMAVTLAILLGIVLVTQGDTAENHPSQLTFVYSRPPNNPMTQWLILIYTEALKRMGIEFVFKDVPPIRAGIQSNKGMVDGELSRVHDYNTKCPNLIRVEEPNHYVIFSAFATDPDIKLDGWDSLKGTTYRVEYRRGVKRCADMLPMLVPSDRLTEIDLIDQGVLNLLKGRIDILVGVRDIIMSPSADPDFRPLFPKFTKLREIHEVGIMEETTGHAWLHKSHANIAPQLAAILHEMKKEGLFEAYRNQIKHLPPEVRW